MSQNDLKIFSYQVVGFRLKRRELLLSESDIFSKQDILIIFHPQCAVDFVLIFKENNIFSKRSMNQQGRSLVIHKFCLLQKVVTHYRS